MKDIWRLMQIIIPNQRGSKPRIGAIGAIMGTIMKKIPIHSIKKPRMKYMNMTMAKEPQRPPGIARTNSSTTFPAKVEKYAGVGDRSGSDEHCHTGDYQCHA